MSITDGQKMEINMNSKITCCNPPETLCMSPLFDCMMGQPCGCPKPVATVALHEGGDFTMADPIMCGKFPGGAFPCTMCCGFGPCAAKVRDVRARVASAFVTDIDV